ncbi:MAG TPA: hypothetical protein VM492_08785, partial [Sumerlaeia bacterium]|nr:hypothetical protein [Sumerlaeia bacterium]
MPRSTKPRSRLLPQSALGRIACGAVDLYRSGFHGVGDERYPDLGRRGFQDPILQEFLSQSDTVRNPAFFETMFRSHLATRMENAARKLGECERITRVEGVEIAPSLLTRSLIEDCVEAVLLMNLRGGDLLSCLIYSITESMGRNVALHRIALPDDKEIKPAGADETLQDLKTLAKRLAVEETPRVMTTGDGSGAGKADKAWEFIMSHMPDRSEESRNWLEICYRFHSQTVHGQGVLYGMARDSHGFRLDLETCAGSREDVGTVQG